MINLENMTPQAFAPFGTVLTFDPNPADPRFEIKISEPDAPWRMAVFCVTIRSAHRLERHVTSLESFTPISGVGVLLCAAPETPGEVHAFLLDTPVCLHKGVWHEVVTLSEKATYQITENLAVQAQFHDLARPICLGVGEELQ